MHVLLIKNVYTVIMVNIDMKRKRTGVTLKWRESDGGGEIVKMHFRRSIARSGRRDAYVSPIYFLPPSIWLLVFLRCVLDSL